MNLEWPNRRSNRLSGYDYSSPGAYFITICVDQRRCVLGRVIGSEMHNSRLGDEINHSWMRVPVRFPTAELDVFQVMPNHFHGIVVLTEAKADGASPIPTMMVPASTMAATAATVIRAGLPSLSAIIGAFKSETGIACNRQLRIAGQQFWQPGFFDHIIRDDDELDRIRQYIVNNPAHWADDRENPDSRR